MRVRHVSFVAAPCLPILTAPLKAADGPKLTGDYQYTPGLDRTVLLLQGDVLIRLGADGVTEKEKWKLAAKYSLIAERADYFVACRTLLGPWWWWTRRRSNRSARAS